MGFHRFKRETSDRWIQSALNNIEILLNDHALLEKKAACMAIQFMKYYPENSSIISSLSKLAREELRHYELVLGYMKKYKYSICKRKPDGYAHGLNLVKTNGGKLEHLDRLLIASIIEARAHERFERLIPFLDSNLANFYSKLAAAEKRHRDLYFGLASDQHDHHLVEERLDYLLVHESVILDNDQGAFGFFSYQ